MRLTTIIALAALTAMPATRAFAWSGREYSKQEVKEMSDASAALSSINPDLSARLKRFADKASVQTKESESQETADTRTADIRTLRDSADSLRTSRPDLAKDLERFADREAAVQKPGRPGGLGQPPSGGY